MKFHCNTVCFLIEVSRIIFYIKSANLLNKEGGVMADTSDRGLGSPNMSEQKKHEIQSKGGQASGGNFKNDRTKASRAGREGGKKSQRS
jgi:general stress protein YciG